MLPQFGPKIASLDVISYYHSPEDLNSSTVPAALALVEQPLHGQTLST